MTRLIQIPTQAVGQWLKNHNKTVNDLPDQIKRFKELDDSARCISRSDLLMLTGLEPLELTALIKDGQIAKSDHRYAKWSIGEAKEIIAKHEITA